VIQIFDIIIVLELLVDLWINMNVYSDV